MDEKRVKNAISGLKLRELINGTFVYPYNINLESDDL